MFRAWFPWTLGLLAGLSARSYAASPPITVTAAEAGEIDPSATPPLPPRDPALAPVSATSGGKRAVPDYDGRPPLPPSAQEALAWAPRVVLFPAHALTEYGIRRPAVSTLNWMSRYAVLTRVYDLFTWDDGNAGIYPIFDVDIGLKSSLGATVYWDELIVPANSLRLSASAAPDGVIQTSLRERLKLFRDGTGRLTLRSHYVKRPDGVFFGIGSDTRPQDKVYFAYTARAIAAGLDGDLGGLNRIGFELGYRDARLGPTDEDPSLETRYGGPGQPPPPPGFDRYGLLQARAGLVLDSRNPRLDLTAGTGVRLEGDVAYGFDPNDSTLEMATWGVVGNAFYDFSGSRHVVGLEVATRFSERLGTREIPFTELPALGGLEWMRGFLSGRLRGDSAFAAGAQYRYPFWTYLDAELFASAGNVFPGHLSGFGPQRLFLNYGVALRTTYSRDTSLALTAAVATNRLDDPAFRLVDSTRFSVGVNRGF